MRAISIQQPWAWAIFRGGKDVENRHHKHGADRAVAAFSHRGPLAIHSSSKYAGVEAFAEVEHLSPVPVGGPGQPGADPAWAFGQILGVVDVVDVHPAVDCDEAGRLCSPWAQLGAAHLRLERPRLLRRGYPWRGNLGLWNLDDPDVLNLLAEVL